MAESESQYDPKPIDTKNVTLDPEVEELTEKLAENNHDHWALQRRADGWRYGPNRDDERKEHPGLVPYAELSDAEKAYDRTSSMETLKTIVALGFRIEKA